MLRLERVHFLLDELRSRFRNRLLEALINDGPVDAVPNRVLVNFIDFFEGLLVNHITK